MSTFIRPSFHVLTLVMLACSCLLIAQSINTLLSVSLLPVPSPSDSPSQAAASPEPRTALSGDLLARYTGLPIAERQKPPMEPPPETLPTQLRLKLLGTLASTDPGQSLASILDDATQRPWTVRVGSSLQGAEIIAIERTRVTLWNAGRTEILDTTSVLGMPEAAPPPLPSPAPTGAPSGFGSTIRATGQDTYAIHRHDVENTLANMAQISSHARIVPAFKEGVAQGFKLFAMRPDSLYARLGLKNGDILQRINGFALDSPTRALEAYNHLRDASRIEIEFERDGQSARKTYTIED